ncbi:MAG: hypothetical protein FJ292_01935 [Planctomycetes bacterium]|nr:hypothetical protein [Planctomycetota bacterium]
MRRLTTSGCTTLVTSLALIAPAFAAPPGGILSAEGHGPLVVAVPLEEELVLNYAERAGLSMIAAPQWVLGPVDVEGLRMEEELEQDSRPLRFSIQRSVQVRLSDGDWLPVEGGRVWRLEVRGLGSLNNRLHLSGLNLGEGQEIHLNTPGIADSMVGPITGTGPFDNGELWGTFASGEVSHLEWFVPNGVEVNALPFTGLEYAHGYKQVFPTQEELDQAIHQEASGCVIDPSCYSQWANVSNGVGQMTFTSGGASYVCTGQLMATTAADETPYFSTANHCISTTAEANSLVVKFFNRANTCNGSVSAGTTVSGGSDFIGTYAGADCTLLMLRNTLPSTVFWVGWDTVNVANSTASTGISHPNGVEQDIHFGPKSSTTTSCNTGAVVAGASRINWTQGTIEGGSSGSGIYKNSDQKLYGILSCGSTSATCTNLGSAWYGRWDLALTTGGFSTFMAAGTDDAQDNNDTCATARPLAPGNYTGLIVKRVDKDFYALMVPPTATLTLSSTYTHAQGDVDFKLYDACGGTLLLDRNANVNNEAFNYVNTTSSSQLILEVSLSTDTRNTYSLNFSVTTPAPANNECSGATAIGDATSSFNTFGATNSANAIPASCNDGGGTAINKDVWFKYTASCSGVASASTCGTAGFDTNIAIYDGASCPGASTAVLACNDTGVGCSGGTSTVEWEAVEGGTYYIRIGSPGSGAGTGTLTTICTAVNLCPNDLDDDGAVGPSDVSVVLLDFGSCSGCRSDVDGDGVTGPSDVSLMLLDFGPCP